LNRNAAVLKADKPPAYDRAAELGTFYRSILPDFQSMCEEEEVRETKDNQPVDNQKQALQAQQGTCPRITEEEEEEEEEAAEAQETRSIAHLSPPPDPARNTPSVASSTTAVERDDPGAITGAQQPEPEHNPQQPQTTSNTWPLATPGPTPSAEPPTPPSPSPSPPPPIPKRHPSRNRRSRITTTTTTNSQHQPHPQHNPAALQICTELLTAQLRTALSLNQDNHRQDQGGSESSNHGMAVTEQTQTQIQNQQQQQPGDDDRERGQKHTQQQVLLLIEAYEGVLRRCRREMMALALGSGSGSGGDDAVGDGGGGGGGEGESDVAGEERRGRVGEAVVILEHWLGTLRGVVCEGGLVGGVVGEGAED
jgi:hypothetical protein